MPKLSDAEAAVENDDPDLDPIEILLVEDDDRLAQLTVRYLANHGVSATVWKSTNRDLQNQYDCIVLDSLACERGPDVCRELRAHSDVPLVMLGEMIGLEAGLAVGADDYIAQPFSAKELLMRIRQAVRLRRASPKMARIPRGPIRVDRESSSR